MSVHQHQLQQSENLNSPLQRLQFYVSLSIVLQSLSALQSAAKAGFDCKPVVYAGEKDSSSAQVGQQATGVQQGRRAGALPHSPVHQASWSGLEGTLLPHSLVPQPSLSGLEGTLFTREPHPVDPELLEVQRLTAEPLVVRAQNGMGMVWQSKPSDVLSQQHCTCVNTTCDSRIGLLV